jgi:dTDP-4-dehydrorhamnose 3,5-epimerase-like enzyme
VKGVNDRFGKEVVGIEIVEHLRRALKLRGQAAHGHLSPEDDQEYRAFAKATYAMEALCFLLMVQDLPIDEQGLERMWGNPLLQNYRQSW